MKRAPGTRKGGAGARKTASKRPPKAAETIVYAPPPGYPEPPEGFAYYPVLLAEMETMAALMDISVRQLRNWINDPGPHPCPAVYREGEGKAPLFSLSAVIAWAQLHRRASTRTYY